MNNYHSLIFICSILILAVCIQSQDSKGPGIALCNFFGERSKSYCGLSNVLITDIPENCSSVFFFAVYMDLNYNATDSNYSSDFKLLDDMLNSGKRIIIYYIHETQEWPTVLGCNSSNEGNNSFDEMKALKGFFDEHPKIAGILLVGLEYQSKSDEIPGLSEKFKKYLDLLKKTFPELIVGVEFRGKFLIDHYTKPLIKWLDINLISSAMDFYVISLEYFNPCTADLINTGIAPMNGSNTKYTLEKLVEALQHLKFPNEKIYFKFGIVPVSPDELEYTCNMTNEKLCVQPQLMCDWCSDTQLSYNEKGKFSANNGAGFMVRYIDFDDPDNCCQCETPYPAFNAILDGFNNVETKTCDLFNRG
ncbi:uncharacterized protein LOC132917951 [Rhopalosiphum padi]|uniref:uncharacterized protein LOC132917951 n=1 Tax=Rhopalosiphum padi TaxID=40932 RepID=UPI00298DAED6|nr:uncharacterized protein LOC132917951 [Rhopalosiphum padi]XP_060834940.1 uncharacterized protein LOC132917951 [Rhopalosiphum padi]